MREDDDVEGISHALPFVLGRDLAEQYGEDFSVALDEHTMPVVEALR